MLRVSITNPEGEDFQVLVDGESAVIGRSPDVDITVPNPLVSAKHLRIDAGAVVRDLRSKNGSWSDGSRLHGPTLIGDGSIVLGPDPERSPAVRVEVLDPDEVPEDALEARTIVSGAAAGWDEPAAVAPVSPNSPGPRKNGRWDSTVIHPLVKPASVGGAGDGDQAFVIDACLQSLRSLESLMQPLGESTPAAPERSREDSAVLAAVESVMARSGDQRARQELLDVLALQRRRIRDRYYAYRRASTKLVEEVRDQSLAEADLSGRAGIPVWQRLFGMRWRVLWTRMRERMNAYDRPRIEARLDDLAKQSVLDGSGASSGRR
ncbi:MAG: FHA domain-containing protein [Planctomycetota bacterium]